MNTWVLLGGAVAVLVYAALMLDERRRESSAGRVGSVPRVPLHGAGILCSDCDERAEWPAVAPKTFMRSDGACSVCASSAVVPVADVRRAQADRREFLRRIAGGALERNNRARSGVTRLKVVR